MRAGQMIGRQQSIEMITASQKTTVDGRPQARLYRQGADHVIEFADRVSCRIDANRIEYVCHDRTDAAPFLLSKPLSLSLLLQGHIVIHGSAVTDGESCVGLLGPSGMGKTTLALALANRGLRVLCDDMMVLHGSDLEASDWRVYPGPRVTKAWPDTYQRFFGDSMSHPRVIQGSEKRWIVSQDQAVETSARLIGFLVLQRGEAETAVELTTPSRTAQYMQLVANTHLNEVEHKLPGHADRLRHLARINGHVPTRILKYPSNLGHVTRVAERVSHVLDDHAI